MSATTGGGVAATMGSGVATAGAVSAAIDPCAVFLLLLDETQAKTAPAPKPSSAPASKPSGSGQLDVYA